MVHLVSRAPIYLCCGLPTARRRAIDLGISAGRTYRDALSSMLPKSGVYIHFPLLSKFLG